MATYTTPGVYVQEIPSLAPSVAQVSTAIPVFIGYTEKGPKLVATRINSILEYTTTFGLAKPSTFSITTATDTTTNTTTISAITRTDTSNFMMYYALSLYFMNGGGSCYIVSLGDYTATPAEADFISALTLLEKEDEPTLIVLPDALNLSASNYYDVCSQALAHCHKLQNRFLIMDVPSSDPKSFNANADANAFRNSFSSNYLNYGAAYYPYLQTTLNYQYLEAGVSVQLVPTSFLWNSASNGIDVTYLGATTDTPKVNINADDTAAASGPIFDTGATQILTITILKTGATTGTQIAAAWSTWKSANPTKLANFNIAANGNGGATVITVTGSALTKTPATMDQLKVSNTAVYNQIKTALTASATYPGVMLTLPPSAAMAGIYASVDRDRGVWKAPANVSVSSVIGPVSKVSDNDQGNLNIDPTGGKSINVIRAFTGKGTLVWGARTLDGNSNEWRYVPVRRLFITIEESTRKASAFAVFEPNDATTWLKVKAMIESYLYGLWQQGALAGSKPDDAYFVDVGLGKTMTAQDILEGRLIIKIGIAAVRPAEFIILQFSHKLQVS